MHYDRGMYGTSEQRRVRLYGTECQRGDTAAAETAV